MRKGRTTAPRGRIRPGHLVCLLIAVLVVTTVPGTATAMTIDEYRVALRGIEERAAALDDPTPEEAVGLAEAIDAAFPEEETLDLGGSAVAVRDERLAALAHELRDAEDSAEIESIAADVEERSSALLDAIGTGEAIDVPEDASTLAEILGDEGSGAKTLGDMLTEWLMDFFEWLNGLFPSFDVTVPTGPGIDLSGAWPYIVGLAAALAAGLLAYLGVKLTARLRAREEEFAEDSETPVIAAAEDLPPDALAYAERLAEAGRFREAVRALFGGAARRLVEIGIIARTKTRTNGELLGDVRLAAPVLVGDLSSLARIFEYAWYGRRDPGATGFGSARVLYDSVVEAATRRPEASE